MSQSRKMLLRQFNLRDGNKSLCQDCRGKGFDLQPSGKRSSRRCSKCKGTGLISVGNTKR